MALVIIEDARLLLLLVNAVTLDGLEAADFVKHHLEIVQGLQRRICEWILCSSSLTKVNSDSSGIGVVGVPLDLAGSYTNAHIRAKLEGLLS